MESINIYLSLKEAESLIFNRSLLINQSRLNVKKAQGLLSVYATVDKPKVLTIGHDLLILFSAIECFNIPQKESNLFQTHYKVPAGLLVFSNRNVRDSSENTLPFDTQTSEYNAQGYLILRNALLGIVSYGLKYLSFPDLQVTASRVLYSFNDSSNFRSKFINEIFAGKSFPILPVKVENFVTDNFFRVTWWGKYIVENYLNDLDEETKVLNRKWLRVFLDGNNFKEINSYLKLIPQELTPDINFLLGYYFAAYHFETLESENEYLMELYSNLDYTDKNELFCWIIFFKSAFAEKMNYIYFINSLKDDIYEIEKVAFRISNPTCQFISEKYFQFNFIELERGKLISDYLSLKFGGTNDNTKLIKLDDAKSVFENSFSARSLHTIGLELQPEHVNSKKFRNLCWNSKDKFNLTLDSNISPSEVTFYISDNSPCRDKLKSLKIKTKSSYSLIDKNKKVLMGFVKHNQDPELYPIYSRILKNEIEANFDKVIFVLLVNIGSEAIQSLEFNNYIKSHQNELRNYFNTNVELIVKNERVDDDSEIKRHLKNAIKNYTMDQLEVIDENFNFKKATWLLASNTEYFIFDDNEQYYCFYNID